MLPGQAAAAQQPQQHRQPNALRQAQIARGPDGYGMSLSRVSDVPVLKAVDQGGPAAAAGAQSGDLVRQVCRKRPPCTCATPGHGPLQVRPHSLLFQSLEDCVATYWCAATRTLNCSNS